MKVSALVTELVQALQCLPGVGSKSAQRLALFLLEHDRNNANHLANTLKEAVAKVGRCQSCRAHTEHDVCLICQHPGRDPSVLCVVETPSDLLALEQSGAYQGLYFVLLGRLSPLDGLGPKEIGMDQLANRLATDDQIKEVVIATNPTVEGEATAHYLQDLIAKSGKKASRIAFGVPFGGELEYTDSNTLSRAFSTRQVLSKT